MCSPSLLKARITIYNASSCNNNGRGTARGQTHGSAPTILTLIVATTIFAGFNLLKDTFLLKPLPNPCIYMAMDGFNAHILQYIISESTHQECFGFIYPNTTGTQVKQHFFVKLTHRCTM